MVFRVPLHRFATIAMTICLAAIAAQVSLPHATADNTSPCPSCNALGTCGDNLQSTTPIETNYVTRCVNTDHVLPAHCASIYQKTFLTIDETYCFKYDCTTALSPGNVCLMTATPAPVPSLPPTPGD